MYSPTKANNDFTEIDKFLKGLKVSNSNSNRTYPEIEINGIKGTWVNEDESDNWAGDIPLSEYPINVDNDPIIIHKKYEDGELDYSQELNVRYLKPPTPSPGAIFIDELPSIPAPELPPIILRQKPQSDHQSEKEVYYREMPPRAPKKIEPVTVRIPGKNMPPPPRKVIIEILPKIPTKPQPILLERWLTPKPVKRRVVYERTPVMLSRQQFESSDQAPEVIINKKYYFIDARVDMKNEKHIDLLVDKMAKTSGTSRSANTKNRIKRYSSLPRLVSQTDGYRNRNSDFNNYREHVN